MTKIAFVVIASKEEPWHSIQKMGQEKTWITTLSDQEQVVFTYSDGNLGKSWINPSNHREICFDRKSRREHCISDPVVVDRHYLTCKSVQGYGSLVSTSLTAMKYLMDSFNPDFVVRTNVSAYWNLERLRDFLSCVQPKEYYAGSPQKLFRGIKGKFSNVQYASGAGIILSRDLVHHLINSLDRISLKYIDDIALGMEMNRISVPLTPINRVDIHSPSDIPVIDPSYLKNNFYFRCKSYVSESNPYDRLDAEVMRLLHQGMT
jgi:hypothetical protein